MQFILTSVYPPVPIATYVVRLMPFITALALAVLFYRWGAYQRPVVKRSLVLVALPWLLGSAHMVWLWRCDDLRRVYGAGARSASTVAAGFANLLGMQAIAAGGAALLLASLGAVLALDVRGVGLQGQERKRDASWTRGALLATTLACVFAIVSIACAGLASHAGTSFLWEMARTGLVEWPAGQDASAIRWAALQAAQWVAAFAALLGLVAGALMRRASTTSKAGRMTPWFAGALLALSSGVHLLATRAVA
ncbi:hypothetical protein [Myxococcus sp. SDU36]|uniref:hypothetical protein n=1 Tax=Myxococcus sp. SDU36 TaxID=2831967 RepID=UPI0025437264|nr:hypothetical protein [Myxococcus sp. SDU36]WIG96486.1 hypothetical protein KGD87_03305 [Myxococcus sp. SDU36]